MVYDWATASFQCDVQDTGIMTRIVKSLGHASVDLASLQPHQQYRMRLPLHTGHGFLSVKMVYHPFATMAPGDVVPSFAPHATLLSAPPSTPDVHAPTPRRRPHTTSTSDTDDVTRFSTAFLFVEVLGCSGLPPGSSARVCVTCNGTVHRTTSLLGNETHYQGYEQYGEAYFFPLQSLTSSAMVHVEEVSEVGDVRARIELLDGSDRLRFGSKPVKHVCTLVSLDNSIKVIGCVGACCSGICASARIPSLSACHGGVALCIVGCVKHLVFKKHCVGVAVDKQLDVVGVGCAEDCH